MARQKFLSWLGNFRHKSGLQYPELSEEIAKDRWLAKSTWTRTGDASYRSIRWAKQRLLRMEENVRPESIRRKYWNRSN